MRNFFCFAALAAGLGQVQVSTPAALREQAVALLVAGKADKARDAARACVMAGDLTCLLIEGRAAFNASDFDAAAKALAAARPTLSDLDAHVGKLLGEALLLGGHPQELFANADLIVLSPGVPADLPQLDMARSRGVEVISEPELAGRFLRGRIIGITGSNGKTTTTALTGELMRAAGAQVIVGGNIGTPLTSLIEQSSDETWTVAELSSFQLEMIDSLRVHVAIVTNITPDHLDRHGTFENYVRAKHRIFRNQTPADVAILNADDERVASWAAGLRAHTVFFSVRRELDEGLFLRAGREIVSRTPDGERVLMMREEMKLRGLHNVENVLAALAAGLACGAAPPSMRETVKSFRPVEHRLEEVAEVEGVRFYNDSKATSVDATLKALEAFADDEGKVVLILGGRGKRAPYAPLAPLIRERVRKLILIGEDTEVIEAELKTDARSERALDMPDAVGRAFAAAQAGDTVLLAPACASFDMFRSFEHRGQSFKEAVSALRLQATGSRSSRLKAEA